MQFSSSDREVDCEKQEERKLQSQCGASPSEGSFPHKCELVNQSQTETSEFSNDMNVIVIENNRKKELPGTVGSKRVSKCIRKKKPIWNLEKQTLFIDALRAHGKDVKRLA